MLPNSNDDAVCEVLLLETVVVVVVVVVLEWGFGVRSDAAHLLLSSLLPSFFCPTNRAVVAVFEN